VEYLIAYIYVFALYYCVVGIFIRNTQKGKILSQWSARQRANKQSAIKALLDVQRNDKEIDFDGKRDPSAKSSTQFYIPRIVP